MRVHLSAQEIEPSPLRWRDYIAAILTAETF